MCGLIERCWQHVCYISWSHAHTTHHILEMTQPTSHAAFAAQVTVGLKSPRGFTPVNRTHLSIFCGSLLISMYLLQKLQQGRGRRASGQGHKYIISRLYQALSAYRVPNSPA